MRLTAQKHLQEPPMSDTRHLSDLKFDERPLSRDPGSQFSSLAPEVPQTDMMMLQKADVWMSQFKTRLNISIIALVVLWGTVSYYKSTGLQMAARSAPEAEQILADGSADEGAIPTMNVDSLKGAMEEIPVPTVETVETEEATISEPVVTPKVESKVEPKVQAAPPVLKKSIAPKAAANKNASRTQKKTKKSVASKP